MKTLFRIAVATLFAVACSVMVFPVEVMAEISLEAQIDIPIADGDLSAIPALGELHVGSRRFSLERVKNGFVARNLDSGDSVVVTDESLREYQLSTPAASAGDGLRVSVGQQQLLGSGPTLTVETHEISASGLTGTLLYGSERMPIAYHSLSDALEVEPEAVGGTDLRRATNEVVIILVVSAAVVGAIACAIVSALTNCIDDCSDACSACGASMTSASEGLCGTCTCTCEAPGIQAEIPNGEGCGVYH